MKSLSYLPLIATLLLNAAISSTTQANDRSLRALTIPASGCQAQPGTTGTFSNLTWLALPNRQFTIVCPLPINNIEMSGTTNDNDITKFRIYFGDTDGPASGASITVALRRAAAPSSFTTICSATLNATATTGYLPSLVTCPHDVTGNGSFYTFEVTLKSSADAIVAFLGIDFPS